MTLPPFIEGTLLTPARMPSERKPIVEDNDRAILQQRRYRLEDADGRIVEIAIYPSDCDLPQSDLSEMRRRTGFLKPTGYNLNATHVELGSLKLGPKLRLAGLVLTG